MYNQCCKSSDVDDTAQCLWCRWDEDARSGILMLKDGGGIMGNGGKRMLQVETGDDVEKYCWRMER